MVPLVHLYLRKAKANKFKQKAILLENEPEAIYFFEAINSENEKYSLTGKVAF
jgi:hypothetical protein